AASGRRGAGPARYGDSSPELIPWPHRHGPLRPEIRDRIWRGCRSHQSHVTVRPEASACHNPWRAEWRLAVKASRRRTSPGGNARPRCRASRGSGAVRVDAIELAHLFDGVAVVPAAGRLHADLPRRGESLVAGRLHVRVDGVRIDVALGLFEVV